MRSFRRANQLQGGLWKPMLAVLVSALLPAGLSPVVLGENIILFIGDGMGFEQVRAARMYNNTALSFETLPCQAQVTTYSANNSVTDSAASGTAMATGAKVNNYVVSMAYPGNGAELQTTLEFHQILRKKVGLITTTYLTHATPATFGAHATDRSLLSDIAYDLLHQTRPNILFGGGGNGLTPQATINAGYQLATDATSFNGLNLTSGPFISAQFGSSFLPYEFDYLGGTYPYPHLSDLVAKALRELVNEPDGFFLMIEGGMIDQACHSNDLQRAIHETLELSRAVQVAFDWAELRTDTLILVTADHETGGLQITRDNYPGYPSVTWSTTGHTAANVPAYAWGAGAERVTGVLDNTDIHRLCTGKPLPVKTTLIAAGATWKYEATGKDLGTAWHNLTFNDFSWPSGPAKLGYGDGNETTLIPKTSPVHPAYYFRHTFTINNPNALESLSLRILRDDGAVVYLNGTEVARYSMPAGTVTYSTWSSSAADYPWDQAVAIPNLLVAGNNVLAVEVHQCNTTSSDLALDLELTALQTEPDFSPPVISSLAVAAGDTSALVTWTTDEPADSEVVYHANGTALSASAGSGALVIAHSVRLEDLTAETSYTYQVRSADNWGNLVTTAPHTFTTTAEVNDPPSTPVLTAVPGDGQVNLSWSACVDPDGTAVAYSIKRDGGLVADVTATTFLDEGLQNGTSYSYVVEASDGVNSSLSNPVIVTPIAPDYNAYVMQDPAMTYGTLTGAYTALDPDDTGVQVLTETKLGLNGQLQAEYALRTIATPGSIASFTVHFTATYADEANDPLRVWLWTGTDWSDITADISDGACVVSDAVNCIDPNGIIRIQFTDSVSVRKETLGVLTLDQLFAEVSFTTDQNRAPNAVSDAASTSVAQPVVIDVLANDSDPDQHTIFIQSVAAPTHGDALITDDQITYTPHTGFIGSDSFSYTISDGTLSATATVSLMVTSNDATLRVQKIEMTANANGKNWKASAAVLVTDASGVPIASATVYGNWYYNNQPLHINVSTLTGLMGVATLTTSPVKTTSGIFSFELTDVALSGYTYLPGPALTEITVP